MVKRYEYRSERHSDLDTFEKYLNAMGRVGWQLVFMREELGPWGSVKIRHLVWSREVENTAYYPQGRDGGELPYTGRARGGGGGGKYAEPARGGGGKGGDTWRCGAQGYGGTSNPMSYNTHPGQGSASSVHPPQDGEVEDS